MTSVSGLRACVRGYLTYQSAERAALKDTLDSIVSQLPETVIFGGMLRDFALGRARDFSSDIDLVSVSSSEEIARAIAKYSPTRNKFGGFRFVKDRQVFDIWAFEDTWAFRQGLVDGHELRDLLKTTFFNVDAFAYSLTNGDCYYSEDWISSIRSRVLDINLAENPSPERMTRRAIRFGCELNFAVGSELAAFLLRHIRLQHLDRVGCLFMLQLKKHVESGANTPFRFSPQSSLFS